MEIAQERIGAIIQEHAEMLTDFAWSVEGTPGEVLLSIMALGNLGEALKERFILVERYAEDD